MFRARNIKNRVNCIQLFEGMEGRTFIIFDVETSGLDPSSDRIVELAACKYQIKERRPVQVGTFDLFIKPPLPLTQDVIDIHGITNEFLEDKPSEEDAFHDIKTFFGPYPILVGHNTEFDISMMKATYNRNGEVFRYEIALDTLEMARDLFTLKEVGDYKLGTLVEAFGLGEGLTFHHASDDITATARLLFCLYMEYKKLPPIPLQYPLYVNSFWFYEGHNKEQRGIYLNTNLGSIYYSTYCKCWMSSKVDLSTVDISSLEKEMLRRTGLPNMAEFGRLTRNKFNVVKDRMRAMRA